MFHGSLSDEENMNLTKLGIAIWNESMLQSKHALVDNLSDPHATLMMANRRREYGNASSVMSK